jgi:OFA family oxalate/formate antiporter-like MFS transporter
MVRSWDNSRAMKVPAGWSRRAFGRKERRTLAGAVLLDLAVSVLFAWDVFVPALSRKLGVATGSLAIVFATGLAAFTVGVLGGGRLADRVAPRRLAAAVGAGVSLGTAGVAVVSSVAALVVVFGVLVGGSTGVGYATAVRAAGTVPTRHGLALGLVVSAYAAGTVAIAPAAAVLLDQVGSAGTFFVLAAVTAVVLTTAAVLLPARAPARQPSRGRRGPVLSGATMRLWLAFGLGSAPGLAAFGHAGELAGGTRAGAVAVTLLSAGNLTGRLVAGPLSDRIGRPLALHVSMAVLVVSSAVLGLAGNPPTALAALTALGTQYGALSTLAPAATADAVPAARLGATYGAVFTGWGIGGLVAPLAAAWAATRLGWNHVSLVFLVPAAFGWIALALPPPRQGAQSRSRPRT